MSLKSINLISIYLLIATSVFYSLAFKLNISDMTSFANDISNQSPTKNAKPNALEDEFLFLLEEQSVSIASKREEETSRAPSVITIITDKEISNMGARTLNDILSTVPGFDIRKTASFGIEVFGVRGLENGNKQTRVFLDGHSIIFPSTGSSVWFFDDLPLKHVKRIEIIRGPGSALYGANAFLAVINVITKDAKDINGIEVSSGFGSYDTGDYNIQYGKEIGDVEVTGFVNLYNTNGLSDKIHMDSISNSPALGGFSSAPGDTDDSRAKIDLNMKLSYKGLEFRAKYLNKDSEPFISPTFALTDDTELEFNYVMGDLRYKFNLGEKFTVKPRIYYDQYDRKIIAESLPDGAIIPADLDGDGDFESFPDGRLAEGFLSNKILGSELQFEYEIFDTNTFTFGFDFEWQREDNIQFNANFQPQTGAAIDGGFQDVGDSPPTKEFVRQIWAVYFQEKWDITKNLGFTFGVRHDHYSDFKGTTNPRIGLVWDFIDNGTLKLLYGQGFRAPDFGQLHTKNNNSFLGNSDLEPEKIRTYEVALAYRFTNTLSANVNYFFNVIRDRILFHPKTDSNDPFVFANTGDANVQGIEFELRKDFGRGNYAFANYTYLDAEALGDRLPGTPKHKANIGLNFGLTKYLNTNIHTFISGKRPREQDDRREDNSGYTLTNLTLTAKEFLDNFKVKASLFNMFDKKYTDPSPANTLPDDLPRPGRTFFIELEYKL